MQFSNETFEETSHRVYERFKNSFLKKVDGIRWNKENATKKIVKYYLNKVALIPTDKFS